MLSPGHSMAVHAGQMFDLMITVPVRYKGLFTETHIFMYCSDPMGICAGREVFGYTKKDTNYAFDERADGSIAGWVRRRGIQLADFSFTPDPAAPIVRIVDQLAKRNLLKSLARPAVPGYRMIESILGTSVHQALRGDAEREVKGTAQTKRLWQGKVDKISRELVQTRQNLGQLPIVLCQR